MTTVQMVLGAVNRLAPPYMKMEWDNVGLLCGRAEQPVHKILVALDPFLNVCREAAEIGADLIVTHHPLIFGELRSVTDANAAGRCILFLAKHDIAAINAHTNLDQAPGGVNDRLAAVLGLRGVTVPNPAGTDEQGRPWGLLRAGECEETTAAELAALVKARLGCPGLRYVDGGRPIRRVAVGGGACGGSLAEAQETGCDALVTADVKYNQFWDARDLGLTLIDAGHFETENPVCGVLAETLQREFPEIPVFISKKHGDPVQYL